MESAGLAFYRGVTILLTPFARLLLEARARKGREERHRLGERFGRANIARPAGPLVWLHGASIGEALALLPLIACLQERGFAALVSTGTRTSAAILRARLPAGAIHQYAPLDLPSAVKAFLDHWRPQLLLLAESEIWPNILRACAARRVPVAVVNARMSDRSRARWRRAPQAARALFSSLALCVAQSRDEARHFAGFGAKHVAVAGNLKLDADPPPVDPHELARWRAAIGARRVLLAASTHANDEALVLVTHARLRSSMPDLLTIIVPRHLDRACAILATANEHGLAARTRGDGPLDPETHVLVADTVGEMGLWLRLATLAVIGKTFRDRTFRDRTIGDGGGQTPIEAVRCGVPILHGPSTYNFADAFAALDEGGGARAVTKDTLHGEAAALLDDPVRRRAMTKAATRAIDALSGGTRRTLDLLGPLLEPMQWPSCGASQQAPAP